MECIDKENRIAVIALHKCRIERICIFQLLNPLNNVHVFVYRTGKLFLDTGRLSGHEDPAGPSHGSYATSLLMLLGQESNEILSKNKKIGAWEMDIAPRTMGCMIKQDLGLSNNKQDNGSGLS